FPLLPEKFLLFPRSLLLCRKSKARPFSSTARSVQPELFHHMCSVGGIVVSIAAFQAVDPGSIPGQRKQQFFTQVYILCRKGPYRSNAANMSAAPLSCEWLRLDF